MCTSIVANGKKRLIGWKLDLAGMEHKVIAERDKVYIACLDATEGWLPLFGANARGDFVAMPTCWPHDARSNPVSAGQPNVILLDIDLLLGNKTLQEVREIAEREGVCSVPGLTFQSQLSDAEGNVLQIVPGQGVRYLETPLYAVMTNFSPFQGDCELHPWMGLDRYATATAMLEQAGETLDVQGCFAILRAVSQTACPTVVSMVFDVAQRTVYWCEQMRWDAVECYQMIPKT